MRNLVLVALTLVIVLFQNCSEVQFSSLPTQAGGALETKPGDRIEFEMVIPEASERKVDILFVIDSSGSMSYEQKQMAKRFSTFIDSLENVDWQVGVTTMIIEDSTKYSGSRGRAVPFSPNENFLGKRSTGANAKFARAIRRPVSCDWSCDDHERGVYAANLFIQNPNNIELFRRGSHLNIVFVSDENENSDGSGLRSLDYPEVLVGRVKQILGPASFTAHAIVSTSGDRDCLNEEGSHTGYIYEEAAELTGGVIGSVCAKDYSSQLKSIGDNIIEKTKSVELPCIPKADSLELTTIPMVETLDWEVIGKGIKFQPALNPGTRVQISLTCSEESKRTRQIGI